nr:hypothetical protein P5643_17640 [Bacillus subtilis]WGD83021.1 hypothetical protein P5664_13520 [Bacillus subtilis]
MSIFNGIKEEQMDILREVGNIGCRPLRLCNGPAVK